MDREPEELQFLGFFGIYREAYKLVSSWRKLFSQITLSLLLPLSFIFLAHSEISNLLFTKISHNEEALEHTREGSPREHSLLDALSSEWATFWLFKAMYLVFVLIFSLLSTSAVVYTVASVYTAKDVTFRKVLSVVPKVWKRLMVTFLWNFIILLVYNTLTIVIIFICLLIIGPGSPAIVTILIILFILYGIGLVYINLVWHLASVISVLEDVYGLGAMKKSQALIKGKLWVTAAIFLTLNLAFFALHMVFAKFVVHGSSLGFGARVGYAMLCFFFLSILMLLGLIVQTVVYFVCKSYHHENIDKSCLADHLEIYQGEYVPLKGSDVQLEQFYV